MFQELVVGVHGLVIQYETNFGVIALQFLEEDRQKENAPPAAAITSTGWIVVGSGSSPSSGGGVPLQDSHHSQSSPSSRKSSATGMRTSFSSNQISTCMSDWGGVNTQGARSRTNEMLKHSMPHAFWNFFTVI